MKVTEVKEYPELGEVVATVNYTEDLGEPGQLVDAKQTAANVIRRIEGDSPAAERPTQGTDSPYYVLGKIKHLCDVMLLDDWVGTDADFTPPADANAAAEAWGYIGMVESLTTMVEVWEQLGWKRAAATAQALADWFGRDTAADFTPPVDPDAIAAAERGAAEEERAAVVGWLEYQSDALRHPHVLAELVKDGYHLRGNDD